MKLKQLIQVMATSLTLLTVAANVQAQTYPSKTIKIIVPAPPGGAIDIIARVVGDKLSASMGQPVIIDNNPKTVISKDWVDKGGHDTLPKELRQPWGSFPDFPPKPPKK